MPVVMLDRVAELTRRLLECLFAGCVQQLTKGLLCLQQRCLRVWLPCAALPTFCLKNLPLQIKNKKLY